MGGVLTICDDLLSISLFVRMIVLDDMEVKTTAIGVDVNQITVICKNA